MSKYITVKRASEIMGVTPHYVRKLIRENKIMGIQIKDSNRWQVDNESLEAYRKTDIFKSDLAQLQKPQEITMKEMVENIEDIFDTDVINYLSNPSPASQIDYNDSLVIDDLLYTLVPRAKGRHKKFKRVTLILNSLGGSLEAAIKIVNVINNYADNFDVIVPLSAKSAATLIALSASQLYMTNISELGPVDPIVQSPSNPNVQVPAKAIRDFIKKYGEEIDSTSQNVGYQILRDKMKAELNPYLLGNYEGALNFARSEVENALNKKINNQDQLRRAVDLFFQPDKSHAYPIMLEDLQKFNLVKHVTEPQLRSIKTLASGYSRFMQMNGVVKLIGNREENKNIAIQQPPQRLVTTENRA